MNTENNEKTNEQMRAELEEALDLVSEKLRQLIYHGSYKLDRFSRDYQTNRLEWAFMGIGTHQIRLEAGNKWRNVKEGTSITVALPDNPITQEVLDMWDRQLIDGDIDYHKKKLESLMKRKEELKPNELWQQ